MNEANLQNLLSNPNTVLVIIIVVLGIAGYVAKALKDSKRGKEYDSIASEMRLNKLPAFQDIAAIYGDEIAKQFPGFSKMILLRYGGLFVSYAQGEFFRAESKQKSKEIRYSRRDTAAGRNSREVEVTETHEYEGVLFDLGREAMPHFNVDYSILRDLYRDFGAAQGGGYAKYFNQKTLELIVNMLPGVSVCSTGKALMFYSKAYSVKDMRQFIQNASKAAEYIIEA